MIIAREADKWTEIELLENLICFLKELLQGR